jgi:hypothetical protein
MGLLMTGTLWGLGLWGAKTLYDQIFGEGSSEGLSEEELQEGLDNSPLDKDAFLQSDEGQALMQQSMAMGQAQAQAQQQGNQFQRDPNTPMGRSNQLYAEASQMADTVKSGTRTLPNREKQLRKAMAHTETLQALKDSQMRTRDFDKAKSRWDHLGMDRSFNQLSEQEKQKFSDGVKHGSMKWNRADWENPQPTTTSNSTTPTATNPGKTNPAPATPEGGPSTFDKIAEGIKDGFDKGIKKILPEEKEGEGTVLKPEETPTSPRVPDGNGGYSQADPLLPQPKAPAPTSPRVPDGKGGYSQADPLLPKPKAPPPSSGGIPTVPIYTQPPKTDRPSNAETIGNVVGPIYDRVIRDGINGITNSDIAPSAREISEIPGNIKSAYSGVSPEQHKAIMEKYSKPKTATGTMGGAFDAGGGFGPETVTLPPTDPFGQPLDSNATPVSPSELPSLDPSAPPNAQPPNQVETPMDSQYNIPGPTLPLAPGQREFLEGEIAKGPQVSPPPREIPRFDSQDVTKVTEEILPSHTEKPAQGIVSKPIEPGKRPHRGRFKNRPLDGPPQGAFHKAPGRPEGVVFNDPKARKAEQERVYRDTMAKVPIVSTVNGRPQITGYKTKELMRQGMGGKSVKWDVDSEKYAGAEDPFGGPSGYAKFDGTIPKMDNGQVEVPKNTNVATVSDFDDPLKKKRKKRIGQIA